MKRSKTIRVLAVTAAFFLLATACGDDDATTDASAATTTSTAAATTTAAPEGPLCAVDGELRKTTILLPFPFAIGFPSLFGAKSLGYYEDEGLDVTIETADGSAAVVQQVVADNVDLGLADPGPIIDAVAAGANLIVPYVYRTRLIYELVAPEGEGVASIADLAGTTVGVSEATAGEVSFLEGLLASNGVDPDTDLEIVETGGGASTAAAFDADRIVAYFSDFFNTLELSFDVPLDKYDLGEFGLLHSASLVVQNDLLDRDPNLIVCFSRALARATEYVFASPEAMVQVLARDYPDQVTDPDGFDILFLKGTLAVDAQYDEAGGLWGWNRPESWAGFVELLSSRGEVSADLDPTILYTNDYIEAANDFDKAAEVAAAESAAPGG